MLGYAIPINFKIEFETKGRDEMIPWCWNSPFVPLTNRFSASDVSSERGKKTGREKLPGNMKGSCSAWAHAEKLDVWKPFLPKSDVCFWTLMRSVTIAQIDKRGQNTLSFFPPFKLLKHFHRIRGKKTSGSVTTSSVREFVSDFQHFSHTWCSLSHVEAQLRTRRWWVADLKLIPFTHNVTHLICELENRLVKTLQFTSCINFYFSHRRIWFRYVYFKVKIFFGPHL